MVVTGSNSTATSCPSSDFTLQQRPAICAGENEGVLRAVAACLGEFAAVCNVAELDSVLEKGAWQKQSDLSAALLIASLARTAPNR